MGCEDKLPAAASHRFGLGLRYQTTAEATAANGRCHPDLTQFARFSPGVARGTCHNVLGLVSQKDTETLASAYASRASVELIQPVLQKLDVRGGGLFDLEATHLVHIVCLKNRVPEIAMTRTGPLVSTKAKTQQAFAIFQHTSL